MKPLSPRVLPLVLLVAVVMTGGLAAPGCGGQTPAGELEVTYYYLPG